MKNRAPDHVTVRRSVAVKVRTLKRTCALVAVDGRERLAKLSLDCNHRTTARRIVVLGDVCATGVRTGHALGRCVALDRELVAPVGVGELRRSGHHAVRANLVNDGITRRPGRADRKDAVCIHQSAWRGNSRSADRKLLETTAMRTFHHPKAGFASLRSVCVKIAVLIVRHEIDKRLGVLFVGRAVRIRRANQDKPGIAAFVTVND